ncbi:MAG: Wzz/FepE/Etk N-terminal domain-containing protein [Mariprofundaceae bacterium]|nr:Wzz/FepE/Etk N-terminal domain-containing protein [Mariprofundaceae bacterium]
MSNPEQSKQESADSRMRADEENDGLMEYWGMIWKQRKMVISLTSVAAILSIVVSLMLTPTYRAEVLLAPVTGDESKGGIGALGGLAGLAGMAGLASSAGSTDENLAVLKSREFIWRFVKDNKLMSVLSEGASEGGEQPGRWQAYRAFSGLMTVRQDRKTQLVTLSVEWKDADLAAQWANALVERLNAYLRQQAISRSEANLGYLNKELAKTSVEDMRQTLFELIAREQKKAMLANTQDEYAFRVLDAAVQPDMKFKPKRASIVIASTLITAFLAMMIAILRESFQQRKINTGRINQGQGK